MFSDDDASSIAWPCMGSDRWPTIVSRTCFAGQGQSKSYPADAGFCEFCFISVSRDVTQILWFVSEAHNDSWGPWMDMVSDLGCGIGRIAARSIISRCRGYPP